MNDLYSDLLNSNNNDTSKTSDLVVCRLFQDDELVLISESKQGSQQHFNVLEKNCKNWKLGVNTDKTKVTIFNKKKLMKERKLLYSKQDIAIVKCYKL